MIVITNKRKITIQMDFDEMDDYIHSLQRLFLDAVDHNVPKMRIKQKEYKILEFLELEEQIQ